MTAIFRTLDGGLWQRVVQSPPSRFFYIPIQHSIKSATGLGYDVSDGVMYSRRVYELAGEIRGAAATSESFAIYIEEPPT